MVIYNYVWVGDMYTFDADSKFAHSIQALLSSSNLIPAEDYVYIWYYDESDFTSHPKASPFPFLSSSFITEPFCKFRNIVSLLQSEPDPSLREIITYMFSIGLLFEIPVLIKDYFVPYLHYRLNKFNAWVVYMDASTYLLQGSIKSLLSSVSQKFIFPVISEKGDFKSKYFDPSNFDHCSFTRLSDKIVEVHKPSKCDVWFSATSFPVDGMEKIFRDLLACQLARLPDTNLFATLFSKDPTPQNFKAYLINNVPGSVCRILRKNINNIAGFLIGHQRREELIMTLRSLHQLRDWADLSALLLDPYLEFTTVRENWCVFLKTNMYKSRLSLDAALRATGRQALVASIAQNVGANEETAITQDSAVTIFKRYGTGNWRSMRLASFPVLDSQSALFLPPPAAPFRPSRTGGGMMPPSDDD